MAKQVHTHRAKNSYLTINNFIPSISTRLNNELLVTFFLETIRNAPSLSRGYIYVLARLIYIQNQLNLQLQGSDNVKRNVWQTSLKKSFARFFANRSVGCHNSSNKLFLIPD